MLKKDLREKYLLKRNSLPQSSIYSKSLSVSCRTMQLPIWDRDYYHIFLTIGSKKELDTSYLISTLQDKGKKIVIPKITGENTLENYLLTSETCFAKNKWGIPEPTGGKLVSPKKIDVVFTPLLAFDLNGNRVGYGKGFYDLFFSQLRDDTLKIGLSFFKAEPAISDITITDIPLDYCVTPKKIYSFTLLSGN